MEAPPLPADAPARIAGWLADEAVDGSYAAFVLRHLDADDSTWRWCCGSMCDPCVQRLGRVVDRARAAFRPPAEGPALPGGAEPA